MPPLVLAPVYNALGAFDEGFADPGEVRFQGSTLEYLESILGRQGHAPVTSLSSRTSDRTLCHVSALCVSSTANAATTRVRVRVSVVRDPHGLGDQHPPLDERVAGGPHQRGVVVLHSGTFNHSFHQSKIYSMSSVFCAASASGDVSLR